MTLVIREDEKRKKNSTFQAIFHPSPRKITSFPQQAIKVVAHSGGQFHILLIICDGQVSEGIHTQNTIDAIVLASAFPLAIVLIGVGDGPWDMMREFDDALPQRNFDNFQFVSMNQVINASGGMGKQSSSSKMEAELALRALMEVPEQYQIIKRMGLLGRNFMSPMTREMAEVLRRKHDLPNQTPPEVVAADAMIQPNST